MIAFRGLAEHVGWLELEPRTSDTGELGFELRLSREPWTFGGLGSIDQGEGRREVAFSSRRRHLYAACAAGYRAVVDALAADEPGKGCTEELSAARVVRVNLPRRERSRQPVVDPIHHIDRIGGARWRHAHREARGYGAVHHCGRCRRISVAERHGE